MQENYNDLARPSDGAEGLGGAETALEICEARGTRLTNLRRRVLEIVERSSKPMGAYKILAKLGQDGDGKAPPSVYRALDFLLEQGLIHRLASLNAYMVCSHPQERHSDQFMICKACGKVMEFDNTVVEQLVRNVAMEVGFKVLDQRVEVIGRCRSCQ